MTFNARRIKFVREEITELRAQAAFLAGLEDERLFVQASDIARRMITTLEGLRDAAENLAQSYTLRVQGANAGEGGELLSHEAHQ
jgi:hypothetical protein